MALAHGQMYRINKDGRKAVITYYNAQTSMVNYKIVTERRNGEKSCVQVTEKTASLLTRMNEEKWSLIP